MPSDNVLSRGQHSPRPPTRLHRCGTILVEFCHKHARVYTTTHQWHRMPDVKIDALTTTLRRLALPASSRHQKRRRFSTHKGDIRIQTQPLTRLAEKPGNTMGGAMKIGLVEIFVISGCSSRPLTRLAFVGREHILTLPARKYCVCIEVSRKGASEPSRSAARVRGRDCQLDFPSPIPIGYPAHMERNSSGVWFGHGNGIWFGDTFCSGPHRH
jgi:hypothetical protein